ncbi:coiled-coil domain-containing protein 6 [Melanaphis sacchari]|uniref:coiled-coil domain-containing protein 6 n=1 Tax=Melanaphis sacchari TaxID=742174 RepID=UPI000DC14723|nr:coiled-coil domain-containing protein 6 [Melanaphis sacchari]
MDLTYLVVAVFGMCVLRPCSSLPAAAAAAAAAAPTPTPSSPSLQVAAAEPAVHNDKRSRSLFQSPPQAPHQYHLHAGGAVDLYDDVMNDLPYYLQHQQHQHQQQQQLLQDPTGEDDLRMTVDEDDDNGENGVGQDIMRLSSRARPAKPDSPMYFIRLPPQPYMYVPGYGYVSQPTRLEPPPFTQRPHSPFLNLPLSYVSNAKPVGIYTLPQQHHQQQQQHLSVRPPKPNRRPQPSPTPPPPPPQQQQPDSPIYNLDKGPYVFNGRPTDVFLLQSAYDNLYSEVLQNIYP